LLIHRIILTPGKARREIQATLQGALDTILEFARDTLKPAAAPSYNKGVLGFAGMTKNVRQ
jgi:hypothetical protein